MKAVLAGLAGLLLAMGWCGAASAQQLPPGSYMGSCRDAQVRNWRDLTAFCATRQGNFIPARLDDFAACRGDISNQNGQLWCERRPGPPPPPPPGPGGFGPPGSYRQSCNRIEYRNTMLSAMCRTRGGDWRPSTLNTAFCRQGADIFNNDGQLGCQTQQQGLPLPPGSYRQSCRNMVLGQAGMLWGQCRAANGQWVTASLNTNFCTGRRDIANLNGRLVCN